MVTSQDVVRIMEQFALRCGRIDNPSTEKLLPKFYEELAIILAEMLEANERDPTVFITECEEYLNAIGVNIETYGRYNYKSDTVNRKVFFTNDPNDT